MADEGKKTRLVTTRISEEAYRRMELERKKQERSRSDFARRALEKTLNCPREDC